MDDTKKPLLEYLGQSEDVGQFADSYASFSRIINSLQRRYLELEEESARQNERLVKANQKLVELTELNLAATEFLNSILDSTSAGIVAVDCMGAVTHVNPAAAALLDIDRASSIGRPYTEVVPGGKPPDAGALEAAVRGREVTSIEKQLELPDGTTRYVSVSTAILKDNGGRPTGAVEVMQDVTKIKRMEREIARLNTLAALGEMAATVAHEVRNPLSGIAGFASLLQKELDPDDPRRKLTGKIIDGVNSLNETVGTLLNYTRIDELDCCEVEYGQFLSEVGAQFSRKHPQIATASAVIVNLPDLKSTPEVPLHVDRLLLRQALFNLLSNALEACGGEGAVTVAYRRLPRAEAVENYADRLLLGIDETVVETTVRDTGPGIPPSHLDRIFAPFFTTKKEGSGMGLAVAWKIAKAHGGDILAANSPAGGAEFTLVLPSRAALLTKEHGL